MRSERDILIDSLIKRLDSMGNELLLLKLKGNESSLPGSEPERPGPPPQPPPPPPGVSYMDVGNGKGRLGDMVAVDIVGGTHLLVTGFAIAVGMGRRLDVVSVVLGEFFQQYLGDTKYFTYTAFPQGWPEPYFVAYLGFWKTPPEYREIPPVIVPPETTLLTVTYRVDPGSPPMDQLLFNQTAHFKKTDSTNEMLRVRNIYTSEDIPAGVSAVLTSGKLTILSG